MPIQRYHHLAQLIDCFIPATMTHESANHVMPPSALSAQEADAAAGEEWPLLDEYERPATTRLDHLIANTPSIQVIESSDRKATAQQQRQQNEEKHVEAHTAPHNSQHEQQTASGQQQGRGAKRSREAHEWREVKELLPAYEPTFRGGGDVEDGDDDDEDNRVDEERLNRVQPDELYDPQMDERDEQRLQQAHGWHSAHIPVCHSPALAHSNAAHVIVVVCCVCLLPAALPSGRHSDAMLSCPCCLTTLCLDCQRHTDFAHQYRAMFVSNCHITTRRVHPTTANTHHQHNRRQRGAGKGRSGEVGGGGQSSEVYLAVECTECGTEVAAVDSDEVYYFFSVLDAASGH